MTCLLNCEGIDTVTVTDGNGSKVNYKVINSKTISFPTSVNGTYLVNFKTGTNDIKTAKKNEISITHNGTSVYISGGNVGKVSVYEAGGKEILHTMKHSFKIPECEKGVLIVSLQKSDGTRESHKIMIK